MPSNGGSEHSVLFALAILRNLSEPQEICSSAPCSEPWRLNRNSSDGYKSWEVHTIKECDRRKYVMDFLSICLGTNQMTMTYHDYLPLLLYPIFGSLLDKRSKPRQLLASSWPSWITNKVRAGHSKGPDQPRSMTRPQENSRKGQKKKKWRSSTSFTWDDHSVLFCTSIVQCC